MAFKPSERRRREDEDVELNITPIMNLMVVLIPLLLSTAKLTELALLEYLPPAAAEEGNGGGGEGEDEPDKAEVKNLSLLVNLTSDAVQISLYNEVEAGPHFYEIPRLANGGYDLKTMSDSLWSIKQREVGDSIGLDSAFDERTQSWTVFPKYKVKDGREVSITGQPETVFQTVVRVMDACKSYKVDIITEEELFPVAILKQFQ